MKALFKLSITRGENALDYKKFSKVIEIDFPISDLTRLEVARAVNPAVHKGGGRKFSDLPQPVYAKIFRIWVNLTNPDHATEVALEHLHLGYDEWDLFGENIANELIKNGWTRHEPPFTE